MKPEQRISEFIEEKISGTDLFVVDLRVLPKNRVVILMDGDNGIPIDKVAEISRHVGNRIEEENLIEYAYTLEVSSPGVDHPLTFKRQYVRNKGRNLSMQMKNGSVRTGTLLEVGEHDILIDETMKEKGKKPVQQEVRILFDDIQEAKVTVSFK